MNIEILDEKKYEQYEQFIKQFEGGLFYYSIKYKNFLEELLHCKAQYYIVLENDKILAVYPLMYKEGKFGKVYNSLPFYGSHGGLLSIDEKASKLIIDTINEISSHGNTATNMYVANLFEDTTCDFVHDIVDKRIGQFTSIDFQNNIEANLMESFHYKTRNMIRKAIKSNIEVFIDNSAFDFLKTVHFENMKAIGGKPKSAIFFKLIKKHFKPTKDYDIYVAKKDEEYISAMLIFYFNKTIEYFTPVVKVEYRSYQPLSFLIYEAMIHSANKGYKYWNWGGTWLTQDGVYRFKSRFGAIDKEYKYYIKVKNNAIYNSSKEELLNEYENFFTIPFEKLK